ncbi:acyltransferase family protein [Nocardioides alcanivorans]|uniref:acyltransferase family protein n=1 Tax=Nocardioides alcanivorans TaxID=2897352 RepID=UPI001F21BFFE|nr:acyltransferase family protein [Nocardioides alcanivorans]
MARDPWLDNAKFALVTLVVFGHILGLVLVDERNVQVYTWIYFFHMPAFVLISGYLSRSFRSDRDHLISLASTLLLPYLIFDAAMYQWREHLGQAQTGAVWLEPHYAMWYLIVLAMWRLATPLLRKHWLVIPLSVPLSLWAGTLDFTLLGIPKAFAMLPFFVIGLHARSSWLAHLTTWWVRIPAVGALVWLWHSAADIQDWARVAFLWWDRSYEVLGYGAEESYEIRARLLAMSLVGALAALALVPRRTTFFTGLGSASLVVYLGHAFAVRWAQSAELFDWAPDHPTAALWTAAGAAVALALSLACPPVSRRLVWVVDPIGSIRRHRSRQVVSPEAPRAESLRDEPETDRPVPGPSDPIR